MRLPLAGTLTRDLRWPARFYLPRWLPKVLVMDLRTRLLSDTIRCAYFINKQSYNPRSGLGLNHGLVLWALELGGLDRNQDLPFSSLVYALAGSLTLTDPTWLFTTMSFLLVIFARFPVCLDRRGLLLDITFVILGGSGTLVWCLFVCFFFLFWLLLLLFMLLALLDWVELEGRGGGFILFFPY